MNNEYKPKNFDEYRELILPAFWHARRKINTGYWFICLALDDYWYCVRKTDIPSNRYGQAECARLMKSVLQGWVTLSGWAEEAGLGTREKYFRNTELGRQLRLDTINMIIGTIKSWKS